MGLSHDDVREILRIIDESDVAELRLQTDGFSLYVRRGDVAASAASQGRASAPQAPPAGAPSTEPPAATTSSGPPAAAPSSAPAAPPAPRDDGLVTIASPMLGTFYRAEAPGAKPLVELGSRVEPDTTVCIIEVMKMMNSVPAGVAGVVQEICVKNSELVEYKQPLFRVAPA